MNGALESWRPVPGYESTYEVSDGGRVRSLPRPRTPGGLLAQRVDRYGYLVVNLHQDGRQRSWKVHRLVALAFLGPPPDGTEVRHLDGNPSHPSATNLAYGTRGENNVDKRRHGTDHNVKKTHCPQGHPYDAENTYVLPSRPSARYCKACARRRGLARYHAKKRCPGYQEKWRP